jgi:hypothetical protein
MFSRSYTYSGVGTPRWVYGLEKRLFTGEIE